MIPGQTADGRSAAPPFERRPERAGDAAFLAALHGETLALPGLDPALVEALLRQQFAAQGAAYRAACPLARFDIIEVAGERVGRIVVDETPEGLRVVDVALRASRRGRGLGTLVLREVMAEAGARPVRLRVAIDNAGARRLYERLGFVVDPAGSPAALAGLKVSAADAAMVWRAHPPRKT